MPLEMTSPKKNGERERANSSASALHTAVVAVSDPAKLMTLFSENPFDSFLTSGNNSCIKPLSMQKEESEVPNQNHH